MEVSRRSFLGSALAAAAMPAFAAGAPSGTKTKVAVQLYSIRDYINPAKGGIGLPKALEEVAKIGFKGVEFAGYWGYSAKELRKMLADNGLVGMGTHVGRMELAPNKIDCTLEFNLTFGNSFVTCPGGGMRPDKSYTGTMDAWWEKIVAFYAEAAETARKYKCRIGYHNHSWEHQEKTHGTTVWDYFFSNTPKEVCMEQDVGWTVTAGGNPCEWFRKFPRRSPAIHAKEVFAKGAPGILGQPGTEADGSPRKGVDWDELFKTTDADGVEWYIVECETNPRTLESIDKSFAFLKAKGRC